MNEITSGEGKVEAVRERYGRIATGEIAGCGCGAGEGTEAALALALGYGAEDLAALPEEANLGLGCGAPVAQLALREGESVLDLGSGAGIDAFLAAQRVGANGRVIGVDMTPEMLAKARAAAERMGFANVEFREGRLEALPVEDGSIDAVTSNCVINLVPDKAAVFREIGRVLKPGGRLVISDILLERPLPEALERDLLAWVGCVAGAVERDRYFADLEAAGLGAIEILRDADYVEVMMAGAPGEAEALLERAGVPLEAVRGIVRSVTFRARKGEATAATPDTGAADSACCDPRSGCAPAPLAAAKTEADCCGDEGCEPCGCPPRTA